MRSLPCLAKPLAALASLALLAGCASSEGPAGLADVGTPGPVVAQPQVVAQPVAGPLPVATQALGAPGSNPPLAAPAAAPPRSDAAIADLSVPGQISRAPDLTLQDFSTIDPVVVPGSDPFAAQRQAATAQTLDPRQSLEAAVQGGLEPGLGAPLLQPAAPAYPRTALAPISTAPEPQATQLFDALDDALFDRGLELAFHGDDTARYVIRSQVSAIPETASTTVLYAFDVFDARGTLRHRVTGMRSIPRASADGWAMVDDATTQAIAAEVATQLVGWLRVNPS